MRWIAALVVCSFALQAQRARTPATSRIPDAGKGAWIHGSVISDLTGQPLLRAQVVLKPVTGATNTVMAETDERGHFVLNRIGPGSYAISARRDGYLMNASPRRGPLRLPPVLQLSEGVHVRDLTFRLRPWAVASGKIRYDDSEPAMGAAVQLYRETVSKGRHTMQLAAAARTNDRGEYRVSGLAPGAYVVAATRNRSTAPDVDEQEPLDDAGRPITEYRYATTFFPSAQKLADASPVRVDSAQEVGGIDIYLKPVPAVRIRGRVTNGLTGNTISQPGIEFRRMSADGLSSISVPATVKPIREGFEIQGVTAGPYLVLCSAETEGRRISARQFLTVTDAPIDNLDLTLQPEREMTGVVRFDDSPRVALTALRVTLEPRSDVSPSAAGEVKEDGQFRFKVVPEEHYDVYVANVPETYYVKFVRIANMDVGPEGISGQAASPNAPLEVTLSAKSGTVVGRAFTDDGNAAGGAFVVAVPDPSRGRAAAYRSGNADEYGVFQLRGLPPGRYTVFAYYEEPPCDYYDETELVSCRTLGRTVELSESSQATIEIRVK